MMVNGRQKIVWAEGDGSEVEKRRDFWEVKVEVIFLALMIKK